MILRFNSTHLLWFLRRWSLAAAPEPTFAHRIAGLLAFAEELHICHDPLVRMVGPPMRNICFVIGNADHQTRRSCRPIDSGARRPRGAIEWNLNKVLGFRMAASLGIRLGGTNSDPRPRRRRSNEFRFGASRLPFRGRVIRLGEVSKAIRSPAAPGYWRQHVHKESARHRMHDRASGSQGVGVKQK